MKKIIVAAVLLLAMTACCGACGTKNQTPLGGTQWKLVAMAGIPAEAMTKEADFFTFTLNATDMMVSGRTNCNRFFGSYKVSGREIDFENMGMTRMACPDMQYESMFVEMLDEADAFEIKGSELMFFDDAKLIATFKAVDMPAVPAVK